MKRWLSVCFVPLFCLSLRVPLRAADSDRPGSDGGYLKRDVLLKDTVNIYDEKGRRVGALKRDFILKDRTNIYDEKGDQRGFMEKDFLFKDRTRIRLDGTD